MKKEEEKEEGEEKEKKKNCAQTLPFDSQRMTVWDPFPQLPHPLEEFTTGL